MDLDKIKAALNVLADRELFTEDGALFAYDGETCFRVGAAPAKLCSAEQEVCSAIVALRNAAPEIAALIEEVERLRTLVDAVKFDALISNYKSARDALRAEATKAKAALAEAVCIGLDAVRDLSQARAEVARLTAATSTVGGLLASEPAGSIAEWVDANGRWRQCRIGSEFGDPVWCARVWFDSRWRGWSAWMGVDIDAFFAPGRLVPADQADTDPATRGPIVAANPHPDGCHTTDATEPTP